MWRFLAVMTGHNMRFFCGKILINEKLLLKIEEKPGFKNLDLSSVLWLKD